MDEESLLRELRGLHPGRGVRRPAVTSWLGPNLKLLLDIGPSTSDDVARTRLMALIDERTERFPRDLKYLFRLASGVSADHPFLEERLLIAQRALDRSVRVLRRRLREAEQLLAEDLANAASETTSDPYDMKGWEWSSQDYRLTLGPRPEVTVTRTCRALMDGISSVHELVAFPDQVGGDIDIEFEAVSGCRLVTIVREGPTRWGVTLALPRPLKRGETQDATIHMRLPNPRALSPYLAVAPLRASHRIAMTVDFGSPPMATSAWALDGVVTSVVSSYTHGQRTFDPAVQRCVAVEFSNARPGLAYGLAWHWSPEAVELGQPASTGGAVHAASR